MTARVNRLNNDAISRKSSKRNDRINNRREGPIFEGDERFFKKVDKLEDNHISGWSIGVVDLMNQNAKHMLAKQVNSEIISKRRAQTYVIEFTSKLNFIYLYFEADFKIR